MTITNRLTLYFLLALGLVLVGFSLVMYALASWHLHRQANGHLHSAMDLLVAAIEVHPGDVQWEPLERRVTLGDSSDPTAVRWTLRDEAGQLIDCSDNVEGRAWPDVLGNWRLLRYQLNAGEFDPKVLNAESIEFTTKPNPALPDDRSAKRVRFTLTAGLSEAPLNSELSSLALALAFVSVVIWVIAATWGHWLCRRALRPVRKMADTARLLQRTPERDSLLSVPTSHDELSDLAEAFNGLLVTLREAAERQRRFAGDASHQLRTPLTATQTAVDVILRRERSPAEYQRVLEIVQRRSRELNQIVETLLSLARQSTPDKSTREIVELNQCCQERLEAWRDHQRRKDLVFEKSDVPLLVHTDAMLVGQVIDNLIDNACKYSRPGSAITLRVAREGADAAISIADEGSGISADELSQVFEPFFRTAQARWNGHSGVGLGLAIANSLVELAGGRLVVSSKVGEGSEFRILFPQHSNLNGASPR